MCGIAGIHRLTPGPVRRGGRLANELLLAIEPRGRDATGHLTITDGGKVTIGKAIVPARGYVKKGGVSFTGNPRTALLHTRFATVGEITTENAHPVVNGRYAAIHNGTIWNHREVFREIRRKRNAAVDSEVIPAVVARYGWADAPKALAKLHGGAATAIVDTKNPDALILARLRDYPLVLMVSKSLIVWASTRDAIERAWKKTYGAEPNACQWIVVPEFTLLRIAGGEITFEPIPRPSFERSTVSTATGRRRLPPTGEWPHSKGTPNPKPGSNRSRKRRSRKAGTPTVPAARSGNASTVGEPLFEIEPYVSDAITDLMRWGDVSRADAEEMILGYSVSDEIPVAEIDDDDSIECPGCRVGTVTVEHGCWYCGVTFEALCDIDSWLRRLDS